MNNIYETPTSNLEVARTSLYKISGVGVATFFGSVLAGGFIMYLNFKRLGLESKARNCILYTVIATVTILGIIFLIPEDMNIPNTAFNLPQLVAMIQIAKNQQQSLIDSHVHSGGTVSSNWKAFGIGLLFSVIIMAIIFGAAFILV